MKNKSIICIICLSFIIVLSIGCVSANDSINDTLSSDLDDSSEILSGNNNNNMKTIDSGSVSGGVVLIDQHSWTEHSEITYDVPSNAKIVSANLYANVYSGSAQSNYGAHADIKFNGELLFSEDLISNSGSTDGTVYIINNHTTKVYSDYEMYYNLTDMLKNFNGTSLKFELDTSELDDYDFDGRIKWLALIIAYDDGDSDVIHYWINSGQTYTKNNLTTSFATSNIENKFNKAILRNVILSSTDATYKFNNEVLIGDAVSGPYYKYHEWDASDMYIPGQDSIVFYKAGVGGYGASLKNVLSLLTLEKNNGVIVSEVATEYTGGDGACYAGVNNTITANIDVNKNGSYIIELLVDGKVVATNEVDLYSNMSSVTIVDPTIRPINETTVNGANNTKVNYTVNIYENGILIGYGSIKVPVLYNGYLGKDLAYPGGGLEFSFNKLITGDVNININGSYFDGISEGGNTIFNLHLPENATITDVFLYISYNWDKTPIDTNDGFPAFNLTFNNVDINDRFVGRYRDQSNLGVWGQFRYGIIIYNVTDLINVGNNTLVLNKSSGLTAFYPSTLITLYNLTNSNTLKLISIGNGADLLAYNIGNVAKRPVNSTNVISIADVNFEKAMWYAFASCANKNKGSLKFNGRFYENVWNGSSSKTTKCFIGDVTDIIDSTNKVSFISTRGTILALQQMIVLTIAPKINTSLIADDITMNCGENKVYSVTLKDSNGTPLVNKVISILVNGISSNFTTDSDGKVILNLKDFKVGRYIIEVSYDGSINYNPQSIVNNIIVKSLAKLTNNKDISMYFGAGKYYQVRLFGDDGKVLSNKFVKFTIGKISKNVKTDKNGYAKFKVDLKPGTYKIKATYEKLSVKNSIKVKPVLTAKNISKKKSKVTMFSAKLVNSKGKVVKGKKITFKIKGKTYKVKTNNKGIATLKIKNLKVGKYIIKSIYGKSTIKNTIKIRK